MVEGLGLKGWGFGGFCFLCGGWMILGAEGLGFEGLDLLRA